MKGYLNERMEQKRGKLDEHLRACSSDVTDCGSVPLAGRSETYCPKPSEGMHSASDVELPARLGTLGGHVWEESIAQLSWRGIGSKEDRL